MRGLLNYNLAVFESDNKFSFPDVLPVFDKVNCENWLDFDTYMSIRDKTKYKNSGVHFYISDYKFNRLWENPKRYLELLTADHIIQPDFSLYYDFPVALQIYNKYRNHWLSAFSSVNGVNMIPNISPSTPECYDWSFLGYPKNSVIAFSDLGCIRDKSSRAILLESYDEMIKRLEPIQILYFTRSKKYAPSEATIITLPYKRGDNIG